MSEQNNSEEIELCESDLERLEESEMIAYLDQEDLDDQELLDACLDLADNSEVRDQSLFEKLRLSG